MSKQRYFPMVPKEKWGDWARALAPMHRRPYAELRWLIGKTDGNVPLAAGVLLIADHARVTVRWAYKLRLDHAAERISRRGAV